MKTRLGMIAATALLLAGIAGAQPTPPPGDAPDQPATDRPPPPPDRPREPGTPRDDRGPGERRDGPDGRRPGPDGPRPGQPPRPGSPEAMRIYLDLVDRYAHVAGDPTRAGVAAVVQTTDLLRSRGPGAVIEHFEQVLPEVKNDAVARAIRLQLVDLYRQTQQTDKAVTLLSEMIRSAPPGGGHPTPPPGR